jgi:2-oxoglutarate ferredoxin oxidoreductase subunit delta
MSKIEISREKCKGCLLCISVCPKGSIKQSKKLNSKGVKPVEFTEGALCIGCSMCAVICPDCAIEVFREE